MSGWFDQLILPAMIAESVWFLALSLYIVLQRRSPQATIAWILTLSLLPIIGIPVYLFFGPRRIERKKLRYAAAKATVRGRARAVVEVEDIAHLDPDFRSIMRLAEKGGDRPRTACTEVYFDGASKFAALEEAIRCAEHHVHLCYYIWEPDEVGTALRDLLVEKARAGVEVRLLLDAFGASAISRAFLRPLREAGAHFSWFNPLRLARLRWRLVNFRTHRKLVVVDGSVGFVGGMNVTRVQTAKVVGDHAWRDTHLRLEGAAVRALQLTFLEDWAYATGEVVATASYLPDPATIPAGDHVVQCVAAGPDRPLSPIRHLFFSAIAVSNHRVWVTSAYFVPDEATLTAMTSAALRGVDVRLLVPETGDVPLVAAAARSYYPELLRAGVRIFEYGHPFLHAKTLVVDDQLTVIGTANIDNRSFQLNFEVVAAIYGVSMTEHLGSQFLRDLERAREVSLESVAQQSFGARLGQAGARLLSPIL